MEVQVEEHSLRMIVDSGASKTAFDLQQVSEWYTEDFERNEELSAGLGTAEMESFFFKIDRLCIGALCIADYEAVAIDLSHVNQSYERLGIPNIQGVLGSDILMQYRGVIDYKKMELRLFVDGRRKA